MAASSSVTSIRPKPHRRQANWAIRKPQSESLELRAASQTACKGRSIRMDNLDTLVTHHLADRLLNPERLTAMLASLASRRAAKATAVDDKLQSGSVPWDADLCGFGGAASPGWSTNRSRWANSRLAGKDVRLIGPLCQPPRT
jgi:hypothetical protein